MRIFFTKHARVRLIERGIKEVIVHDILESPDLVYQTYDNKSAYRKEIQGEKIEVICLKLGDKFLVITAYYL
ncbi:MAG: DUF4258 domain-containing protein [Patescibacteria group bacterium]